MSFFSTRLEQITARTRRHKGALCACMLLGTSKKSDLGFLLETLAGLTRCEDTVAEVPEHGLGVLLEDLNHVADPLRVAQRLQHKVGKDVDGIGIVIFDGSAPDGEAVFQEAVQALQKSRNGDDPVYSCPDRQTEALARLQLEHDLEHAVEHGKLVTHYQPIFNLKDGILTGFEALVRWPHPTRGLLLPGEFLSVAEVRGYLLKIDEFVLRQALEQIPIWNAVSGRPIYLSANLCSAHFLKADHLSHLVDTLNTHPKSLELLRIDVSEQVLFDQSGIESLKALENLRIGFNLDDFGVDSESFHCLGSFPFNSLKIDRTLICQMEDEVNAELIVAVLRIAKRMGMKTIAEGVVTHAQLEELRNLGCTEAQGFLFSEAVDVEEAAELINYEYRW